jgi:hypothetical protein
LLHVAVDDVRQGGDPRLPLELALVKVTRPGADLSRESTAYRLEQLENRVRGEPHRPVETQRPPQAPEPGPPAEAPPAATVAPAAAPVEEGPPLALDDIQAAWKPTILQAVSERSIPTYSVLTEARPVALDGGRLVLEFPPSASFHRGLAEEPKNADVLAGVLHDVTGRRLAVAFELGEGVVEETAEAEDEPATEEEIIALVQTTFDTRKVEEDPE